jgi:SAM-dependent methyltransferase
MARVTQSGESVSFDRAAGFYDATRGLSATVTATQTGQLQDALRDVDGLTLEIGVGTGRVALPLAEAGQQLVGVDLSAAMLGRLREKAPDALPLVQADATRLPFGSGTFGAAVVAHVLHLVADWRTVVAELRRVVRPGGVLLVTRGSPRTGLHAEIQRRVRATAGWTLPPGRLDGLGDLDELVTAAGGTATRLPPIPTDEPASAEDQLRGIEDNLYSWTWDMSDDTRAAAAAEVRAWVGETHGDPATVVLPSTPVQWHRYRLPGAYRLPGPSELPGA